MKGSIVKNVMQRLAWDVSRQYRAAKLLESCDSAAQRNRRGTTHGKSWLWCFCVTLGRVRIQVAQRNFGRFGIVSDGIGTDGVYLRDDSCLADIDRAARALGFTSAEMAQLVYAIVRSLLDHYANEGAKFVEGGLFERLETL